MAQEYRSYPAGLKLTGRQSRKSKAYAGAKSKEIYGSPADIRKAGLNREISRYLFAAGGNRIV